MGIVELVEDAVIGPPLIAVLVEVDNLLEHLWILLLVLIGNAVLSENTRPFLREAL